MVKSFFKFGKRTFFITLEVFAVLLVLMAIAIGVFMWRVSKGPINAGFAKTYIESALSNQSEGLNVHFGDIVFSWPNQKGPFQLNVKNVKIEQEGGDSPGLTIDEANVGLSRRSLMFGMIRPVSVMIKGPSLELVRQQGGHLDLFWQNHRVSQDEEAAVPSENKSGQEIAQFFEDMANGRPRKAGFLARLNSFVIKDAGVAVRDHESGVSWYLTDLDFSLERQKNRDVEASLIVELPGGPQKTAGLAVGLVYRKSTKDFLATADIQDLNPSMISKFLPFPEGIVGQDMSLSGEMEALLDEHFTLTDARLYGTIPTGVLTLPKQYDDPIVLKDIKIESNYDGSQGLLTLSDLSGTIGGIPFEGSGQGLFGPDSFRAPLKLALTQDVELKDIAALFPNSEKDGGAYHWIGQRLSGGKFHDVALSMELSGDKTKDPETQRDKWTTHMPQLELGFAFEGVKVQYSPTLMPAEDAKGRGRLDLGHDVLEIDGESARIGDIQGSNVKVKVSDLTVVGGGFAEISLHAKGPLATALKYIADEPISLGEKVGLDPAKVKGTAEMDVTISLPTVKDLPKEDVNVQVNATMTDVELPGVVEGLTLTGGPMTLVTEQGGFTINGTGQLAGQPVTFNYKQYFDSTGKPFDMQVKAKVDADQNLRHHFGIDLDEYITGALPIDVVYTSQGGGNAVIDVKGDLNPVQVDIAPFAYQKPVNVAGDLSFQARLEKNSLKELKNLSVKSQNLNLANARITFAAQNGKKADLDEGSLPGLTLGKSKLDISFDVTSKNLMKITAKGSVFDASAFIDASPKQESLSIKTPAVPKRAAAATPPKDIKPMTISLQADQMITKEGRSAKNTKLYMETDADGDITQIEFDAVAGTGPVTVRFKPDATGKRTFRLQAQDAGAMLRTFNLYENVNGGTLLIYGEPKKGDKKGDLYGVARMENFRVVKAPVLAKLLSIMSLTGVTQLLGNEGLVFSKLESEFEWLFRTGGNYLVLKNGKTSGSSIGLTFEGMVNRGAGTTDVGGTIIPLTEVNNLIGRIPLIGNLLGGDSGLIAATYSIKGPSKDPSVSVNPLSVLAPGFLRKILFEGGYETKVPDDNAKAPAAPAKNVKAATAKNPNRANEAVNR